MNTLLTSTLATLTLASLAIAQRPVPSADTGSIDVAAGKHWDLVMDDDHTEGQHGNSGYTTITVEARPGVTGSGSATIPPAHWASDTSQLTANGFEWAFYQYTGMVVDGRAASWGHLNVDANVKITNDEAAGLSLAVMRFTDTLGQNTQVDTDKAAGETSSGTIGVPVLIMIGSNPVPITIPITVGTGVGSYPDSDIKPVPFKRACVEMYAYELATSAHIRVSASAIAFGAHVECTLSSDYQVSVTLDDCPDNENKY